jgi:large subunit ribosomal protein L36e
MTNTSPTYNNYIVGKMAKEKRTKRTGLTVSLKCSHKTKAGVLKLELSRTKGHLSKRTAFVKEIVKEVSGFTSYKRHIIELLCNSKGKRAHKLAKKRLSTFSCAKAKVNELQDR